MKRLQRVSFSLIAASIVLFSSSQVFSQWDTVYHQGTYFISGFFFNELTGLIGSQGDANGSGGTANDRGIFKTTDGGKTWVKAKIPFGYNKNITQIFMTDNLRGWATIEDDIKPSIWNTVDGGLTWNAVGTYVGYNNIYETPSAVTALSRNLDPNPPYYPVLISTNAGVTFTPTALTLKNGIDFTDNLHGVITGFTVNNGKGNKSNWLQTSDGGKTWAQIAPVQNIEAWSVYAVKGTQVFYAAPEGNYPIAPTSARVTSIMRSGDNGSNWTTPTTLNFLTTGHIAGVGEILYVQAAQLDNPAGSGVYRSTDHGITWVSVGGPSHDRDTRFVVTGCKGGIVYAFDKFGNVLKTRTGGDGAIIEPPVEPVIQGNPIVFSGPICSTSYAALDIENLYCYDDTILSATLVDTTSPIITSGALTITASPSFPLWLPPDTRDSIRFTWQPSKIFHSDTTVTIKVKVKYFSKILDQTFDTIVTVSVHAIGEIPQATVAPVNLNFNSVSFCTPHDTSFIIHNNGCDTLHVLNANPNAPIQYQILDSNGNALSFPLAIAPTDSEKIIIRLKLNTAGNFASDLVLRLFHQGIEKDTTINIAAIISAKASYSLPDSVDFDSVSTCVTIDSLLHIKNLGCVPITVTSASLKSNTVFTLVSSPSGIQPNTTGIVDIKFSPKTQQPEIDTLTLVFFALGEKQTKKIVIRGVGVLHPAQFVLSISADTLFNLNLTRCDSPFVYKVKISNPGCQQIAIIKADLQGAPTPDISMTSSALLPINDGAIDSVTVTVTPRILGSYSGFLHINYQVNGNAPSDTLLAYFLNVGYGSRILAIDHDTIDLGTMRLCDSRDSAINAINLGCDTLNITAVNIQSNGAFTLTGNPKSFLIESQSTRIPFHFDPIGAGNIVGTLTVSTISDSIPIRNITIIAHVIPTDTIIFTMLPTRNNFDADDTLTVSLIPQQNIHGRGLHDVTFTINYNSDLLTLLDPPIGAQSSYGTVIQPPAFGTPKHTAVRIGLIGNPTLELDAGTPAITFRYTVALTDSISTGFDLTSILLNGGDPTFSKCDLGIISASLTYNLTYLCGDSTIVKFMQLGKNLKIFTDAIYPNPLSELNNYQAILPFTVSSAGEYEMKIYDGMGRMGQSSTLTVPMAGTYSFTIDGRNLSSGCYNYLLRSMENSSGSIRGRFIIAK